MSNQNQQQQQQNAGGWFSSFSDQFNQIKDVITNENPQYYDEDQLNRDGDDLEDQIIMLRAEVNKYKMENEELEKRSLESEQNIASVTKEFSRLMSEKESELTELRNVNTNLKQSLMSPASSSGVTGSMNSPQQKEQQMQSNDLNGHSSLGLTLENENNMVYDDDDTGLVSGSNEDLQSLQLQLKKQSENYQNQISALQQLHQDKIFKLNHQIETLQQEMEHFNDMNQSDSALNDTLKKENENLKEEMKKINLVATKYNGSTDQGNTSDNKVDIESLFEKLTKQIEQHEEKEKKREEEELSSTKSIPTTEVVVDKSQQQEIDTLKEQLQKSTKELARLKQHLLTIEDNHTTTDLENEEKISQLEQQLKELSEKSNTNKNTSEINEKLGRELEEKDEELKRTTIALTNLQSVLEQFQADQETTIQTELVSVHQKIKDSQSEINRLQQEKQEYEQLKLKHQELQQLVTHLEQRLTIKDKEYQTLREDIEPLKMAFDKNINRLSDMCLQEQESVDKRIVSKLFLTYFNVKGTKKSDVLELIAKILSFNDDEKATIGLTKRQWSLIPFFGNGTTPEQNGEKSLTDMWIEFLLKEAETNNNNNNNYDINSILQTNTPPSTPFSTPTKQNPNTPMAPPPSPSTPYKQPIPINNSYFSVTPNHNGKLKSTVIYDGDIKNNL